MSQKWTSCLQGKFVRGPHPRGVTSPHSTGHFPASFVQWQSCPGARKELTEALETLRRGTEQVVSPGLQKKHLFILFLETGKYTSIGQLKLSIWKKNSKCTHTLFYSNIWDQFQFDKTLTLKKSWLFLCTDCNPKIATKNTWSPETPSPHSNGRRDLRIRLHKATQSPPSV